MFLPYKMPRYTHPEKLELAVTDASGKLIPGPRGPRGPPGRVITQNSRSLKVQMIGDKIMPVINQGFLWEAEVLPPPGFTVPGTFTFYRATVLDLEGLSIAEMFNANGGINHTQVDEVHTSVLAHYRNGVLLDLHSVSSQVPGTENFLLAQTLHDVVINDQLYFAISPNTSSLTSFNYNLGSIKMKPGGKLPPPNSVGFLDISLPPQNAYVGGQTFCYVATQDLSFDLGIISSNGGGGAGETSTNDGGGAKIGRGGGGGGQVFFTNTNVTMSTGDTLSIFLGDGGRGGKAGATGTDADGEPGQTSIVKLNDMMIVEVPGTFGGKGGINGGNGGDAFGSPGGGGGAPLIDGSPGTPGKGGFATGSSTSRDGDDGGTDPRNGGKSYNIIFPTQMENGGKGGTSTSEMGSGGGGGGGGGLGGNGGDGGAPGEPGNPGDPGKPPSAAMEFAGGTGGGAGGGGGSGGLPPPGGDPVLGGDGGKGFFACAVLEQR